MMRWLLLIALLLPNFIFAQLTEDEKQRIIERSIEFIGDDLEDSDIDLTTYFDDLYFFFDHPINLNQTNFDELKRLHLLTDVQIQYLLSYIDKYGQVLTVYELSAVDGFDKEKVDILLTFVQVG